MAKITAQALSGKAGSVGAITFQRIGDPDGGEFSDAEIICRFGETPRDLSTLQI